MVVRRRLFGSGMLGLVIRRVMVLALGVIGFGARVNVAHPFIDFPLALVGMRGMLSTLPLVAAARALIIC